MRKIYSCSLCLENHFYDSKIGKQHLNNKMKTHIKARYCYNKECKKKLHLGSAFEPRHEFLFIEHCISFKNIGELIKLWNNPSIELFCFSCYKEIVLRSENILKEEELNDISFSVSARTCPLCMSLNEIMNIRKALKSNIEIRDQFIKLLKDKKNYSNIKTGILCCNCFAKVFQ